MKGGDGEQYTACVGANGRCKCHCSGADRWPATGLPTWARFGVREAAADLGGKVSSGTMRYSLWAPKMRPLGGRRKRAARGHQKRGRGPPSVHWQGRRGVEWAEADGDRKCRI